MASHLPSLTLVPPLTTILTTVDNRRVGQSTDNIAYSSRTNGILLQYPTMGICLTDNHNIWFGFYPMISYFIE